MVLSSSEEKGLHKLRETCLGVLVLGWLLSFGNQVSWGYYPPLQATATHDTHSVTYTVYNPQKQQGYVESFATLGTVVNLQQHNGVIAWVVQEDDGYHVGMTTFDPGLNTFQSDWHGPFIAVGHLSVNDGVVAYSTIELHGNLDCVNHGCATYDPAKGAWQYNTHLSYAWEDWDNAFTLGVINQEGVVIQTIFFYETSGIVFYAYIYDFQIGTWSNAASGALDSSLIVYVSNATIYYAVSGYTYSIGFQPGTPNWNYGGTTPPTAYFTAQPDFGKKPLWVWFTDMSIGGASWNWNFGDNNNSTSRSPYHTFTSTGIFQVSQQINGNSTYSQDVTVVNTFGFNKGSLPASLYLLLNNN